MPNLFRRAKPESQPPFVTFNEVCEIMPKERVISIHDAVQFLGRDPQTIESAIDLAMSKDELVTIARAGTYVFAPVIDTPLTLSLYRANKIVSTHKGLRTYPRIVPARFTKASPGYRLVQIAPHPQTIGYGFEEQEHILGQQMHGQKVIGPHALAFAAILFHELRGLQLVGSGMVRTREKVAPALHIGLQFRQGKVVFDFVPSAATLGVGAIGEVLL